MAKNSDTLAALLLALLARSKTEEFERALDRLGEEADKEVDTGHDDGKNH
jgi:hypothetical protein